MGNEESTQASRNHTYYRAKDVISVLYTLLDINQAYCWSSFPLITEISVVSFISTHDYIKLIIDFGFSSGKHSGIHKRKHY